jgi:hypothetical protein
MAETARVEVGRELLEGLRARYPGKTDREMIERLAIIDLGMAALRETQRVDADPEDVVLAEAVKAVHEVRDGMRREASSPRQLRG